MVQKSHGWQDDLTVTFLRYNVSSDMILTQPIGLICYEGDTYSLPSPFTYIGCFEAQDWSVSFTTSDPGACFARCGSYQYFAIRDNSQCFCGAFVQSGTPDGDCPSCVNGFCGGQNSDSVFAIHGSI